MTRAPYGHANEGDMGDPHLIGPVPRTSSAKTNAARGPRALPDDLLRDASRRLGIISLVAGGLWLLATALSHVAVRSMSHGDPQWLQIGMPEAIAAFSIVVSVLLFFYTRRGAARSKDDAGSRTGVPGADRRGAWPGVPLEPDADGEADRARDLMDRRRRPHVCRDRAEHARKDARRRPDCRLDEPDGDADRPGTRDLALRARERRPADALSRLPARRRRGRHLPHRHLARPAGRESARDGQLPDWRTARARRDGRSLQGDAPHARPARGDQADSSRDDRRGQPGRRAAGGHALPARGAGGSQPAVAAYRGAL